MKDVKERTKNWWRQNLANLITIAGLITSSLLLFELVFNPKRLKRITVFYLLSGASDFADGKIARWFKVESPFGSIADQFRDKVLFCPSQIIMVIQYSDRFHSSFLALIFVFAILELLTFFGGTIGIFWYVKGSKKIKINSSDWGKRKTFAGFIAGLMIISYIHTANQVFLGIAYLTLVFMIFWSLKSLAEYKERVWPKNNKAQ